MRRIVHRFRRLLRAFAKDRRGIAAVEFALLVPLMVVLYFGTVETTTAIHANRRVYVAARSLSDLAARFTQIKPADFDDILSAAEASFVPYPTNSLGLKLTGISIDTSGKAKVAWSVAKRATAATCGATVTLVNSLKPPTGTAGFLILAETNYSFKPTVGYVLTGTLPMSALIYSAPRVGNNIPRNPAQC